jgi:L,D-peptidoglycan transpeptidase YkuD (ErfK/YbiS/YcfS/YnhG family)
MRDKSRLIANAWAEPRTMVRKITRLYVSACAAERQKGVLRAGHVHFVCALGRAGIVGQKCEGDGGTPRGSLQVRRVFFRNDRMPRPQTILPLHAIRRDDAWCDDTHDRRYNRLIRRPEGEPEERLWRDDHVYDVIVELGWNDRPVRKGRGSAIFWHLARPHFGPTAGCVAVKRDIFRKVLPRLARNCVLLVR